MLALQVQTCLQSLGALESGKLWPLAPLKFAHLLPCRVDHANGPGMVGTRQ